MTEEQISRFFQRIDNLTTEHTPLFGKMNVHQMVCHCTDQIRLAIGTIRAEVYGQVHPEEIIALSRSDKTVPAPKGMGQVEGGGTKPTNLAEDLEILKQHISEFSKLDDNYNFQPHPYFGSYDKKQWKRLTAYHLDDHLKQFNV